MILCAMLMVILRAQHRRSDIPMPSLIKVLRKVEGGAVSYVVINLVVNELSFLTDWIFLIPPLLRCIGS